MRVGQNVGQKGTQKHHFKPQNDPNLCMGTDFRKCTNKKISDNRLIIRDSLRDPAGARTRDPNIKSVVLYRLSYRINARQMRYSSILVVQM